MGVVDVDGRDLVVPWTSRRHVALGEAGER